MITSNHKIALFGGATALNFSEHARWGLVSEPGATGQSGQLIMRPLSTDSAPAVGELSLVNRDAVGIEPEVVLTFGDVTRIDAMINSLQRLKTEMHLQAEVFAANQLLQQAGANQRAHRDMLKAVTTAK